MYLPKIGETLASEKRITPDGWEVRPLEITVVDRQVRPAGEPYYDLTGETDDGRTWTALFCDDGDDTPPLWYLEADSFPSRFR